MSNSILREMGRLRRSGAVPADTTLLCANNVKISAHSLLCSAISPVLRAALDPNAGYKEAHDRAIRLEWAPADHIEKMFDFACDCNPAGGRSLCGRGSEGGFEVTADDAIDLLPLADRLDYQHLKTACQSKLLSVLTTDNAQNILNCAEACNCRDLADRARSILATLDIFTSGGAAPEVVRSLLHGKNGLVQRRNEIKDAISTSEKKLEVTEGEIGDVQGKIEYEIEKAFQEASAITSDRNDIDTAYPHEVKRTLRVVAMKQGKSPWVLGDNKDGTECNNDESSVYSDFIRETPDGHYGKRSAKKQRKSLPSGYYKSLFDAVKAAQSGDMIELESGVHEWCNELPRRQIVAPSYDKSLGVIRKSLQIVGAADDVTVSIGPKWDKCPFLVSGADFRIANAMICSGILSTFKHVSRFDRHRAVSVGVEIKEHGRLWIEDCAIVLGNEFESSNISVCQGSSAVLQRCSIRGGQQSALVIDPEADNVLVADCGISGSASSDPTDSSRTYVPGEAGAVEIRVIDSGLSSPNPSVKLMVRGSTITSCYGPGMSYRTDYYVRELGGWQVSGQRHHSWPGSAMVTLDGNIVRGNGLALPPKSVLDGEVLYHNEHPQRYDREKQRRQGEPRLNL